MGEKEDQERGRCGKRQKGRTKRIRKCVDEWRGKRTGGIKGGRGRVG